MAASPSGVYVLGVHGVGLLTHSQSTFLPMGILDFHAVVISAGNKMKLGPLECRLLNTWRLDDAATSNMGSLPEEAQAGVGGGSF